MRFLLYQQFHLHPRGHHPNHFHHQRFPYHFRQAGNEPYGRPDRQAGPGITIPSNSFNVIPKNTPGNKLVII